MRPDPSYRSTASIIGRSALVAALSVLLAVVPITAQPPEGEETVEQQVTVTVSQRDLTVPTDGSFYFTVATQVTIPTEYLEVRLRIFNPGGGLLFQKTEIRPDVGPGMVRVTFERDIIDLDLPEARYPVDVRVLATDAEPTVVDDRMLVIDPDRPRLPVAFVARFSCSPATDPEGRFVVDPAYSDTHDSAVRIAALGSTDGRPVSVGLPPVMLEDWLRVSGGYAKTGPEGVTQFEVDGPVPQAYAHALDRLRNAAEDGDFELLDVPYADPDLVGIQAMTALEDLAEHLRRGQSIYQATLGTVPVPGVALADDACPAEAIGVLESREAEFVLVSRASVTSGEETAAPGAYRIAGSHMTALVVDDEASAALTGDGDMRALIDHLFDAALSEDGQVPIVIQTWFGPGRHGDVDLFGEALDIVGSLPWMGLVTASEAAAQAGDIEVDLPEQAPPGPPAPVGYWSEVLEARRLSMAFVAAAGEADPDAEAALIEMLVAQSRSWAGPDGGWGLADRGRAYAASSVRRAESVLAAITISIEDITLAGQSGKIPLNVQNGSDKTLTVTIHAEADRARIGPPGTIEAVLLPADNFITIPVSMASALSDRVSIVVQAGDIVITTAEMSVRASYLDRLVVVVSVVLVLSLLLFYIRRKVMS